jgi:GNAT superfamily N-acetyltransferase
MKITALGSSARLRPSRLWWRTLASWFGRGDQPRRQPQRSIPEAPVKVPLDNVFPPILPFHAQAFVTNPLNIAAFGPSQLAKNEAFFRLGLAAMKGPKLVATDGSGIVGLIHWVPSPDCQLPWFEKLRMAPAMAKAFGLGSALRVASWLSTWSKHDPSTAHSHLGPIGVLPEVQGQHIGHGLMKEYCKELDRTGEAGYLETDRPENVSFYSRFGF